MPCSTISAYLTSPAFTSIMVKTIPSLLAATVFTFIMFAAIVKFMSCKSRFMWMLILAAMLQSAGFVAFAVHSYDLSNHMAFLASFSTVIVAPVVLAIANINAFDRLIESISPFEKRGGQVWVRASFNSIALSTVLIFSLALVGFGIYDISSFLSPEPIVGAAAALERLRHYERGVRILALAQAMQATLLCIFGFIAGAFMMKGAAWHVDAKPTKRTSVKTLLRAINAVNALILARTVYKIFELTGISGGHLNIVDSGILFWACDAAPMLMAFLLFCWVVPGAHPETSTSDAFMDEKLPLDVKVLYTDVKLPYDSNNW